MASVTSGTTGGLYSGVVCSIHIEAIYGPVPHAFPTIFSNSVANRAPTALVQTSSGPQIFPRPTHFCTPRSGPEEYDGEHHRELMDPRLEFFRALSGIHGTHRYRCDLSWVGLVPGSYLGIVVGMYVVGSPFHHILFRSQVQEGDRGIGRYA